jgi:hypothetical protein
MPAMITSGSIDQSQSVKTSDNEELALDDIGLLDPEAFMNKLLDSSWVQSELGNIACTPYYMLMADHSPVVLFSVGLKTYRTVPCPIEISPIEPAGEGKTYCMIGHDIFIVDDKLIKNVGWN